jgi:hypothetical protein
MKGSKELLGSTNQGRGEVDMRRRATESPILRNISQQQQI